MPTVFERDCGELKTQLACEHTHMTMVDGDVNGGDDDDNGGDDKKHICHANTK
jgi:hypothetical protein